MRVKSLVFIEASHFRENFEKDIRKLPDSERIFSSECGMEILIWGMTIFLSRARREVKTEVSIRANSPFAFRGT
jgi:hypothetical protein